MKKNAKGDKNENISSGQTGGSAKPILTNRLRSLTCVIVIIVKRPWLWRVTCNGQMDKHGIIGPSPVFAAEFSSVLVDSDLSVFAE